MSPVGLSNWLIFFIHNSSHAPVGLFHHSAPSLCPSCVLVGVLTRERVSGASSLVCTVLNVCLLDPKMLVFLDEADLFFGNIAVATLCILLGYLIIYFYRLLFWDKRYVRSSGYSMAGSRATVKRQA